MTNVQMSIEGDEEHWLTIQVIFSNNLGRSTKSIHFTTSDLLSNYPSNNDFHSLEQWIPFQNEWLPVNLLIEISLTIFYEFLTCRLVTSGFVAG